MLDKWTNILLTGYRAKLLIVVPLSPRRIDTLSAFRLMSDGAICESCFLIVVTCIKDSIRSRIHE
jgi:hypothetical protein